MFCVFHHLLAATFLHIYVFIYGCFLVYLRVIHAHLHFCFGTHLHSYLWLSKLVRAGSHIGLSGSILVWGWGAKDYVPN